VKGWGDDVAAETPGHFRSCPNPVRLNVAIREQLLAAVDGRRGVEAADRLCEACVVLLDIDAATISLVFDGGSSGTLGSSGAPARMYDELQFTLGEGALDLVCAQPGPLSSVREWHFEHNPVTVGLTGGLQTRYGRDRLQIAAVTFPGGCGVNRDKRYRRGARTRESLNAVDVRGFCQLNSRQASSLNRYGSSIQPGSIVRRRIRLGRSRKRCIAMVGL